jgi:SAM-dependent methyltransferase
LAVPDSRKTVMAWPWPPSDSFVEVAWQTCWVTDHYADGTYRWWHLSGPSPELLQGLADGWLPSSGRALDVGCGLGSEAVHLHRLGWRVVGLDLSAVALITATAQNPGPAYVRADLLHTPLRSSSIDVCLDRGCFQYLATQDRGGYAAELRRVLRPGGKLLLRASLRAAGVRNDISENVIGGTFSAWRIEQMQRAEIPSDTRTLEVLLVRLAR